jgi:hypothetical protein
MNLKDFYIGNDFVVTCYQFNLNLILFKLKNSDLMPSSLFKLKITKNKQVFAIILLKFFKAHHV